jgi:hypothetical protein
VRAANPRNVADMGGGRSRLLLVPLPGELVTFRAVDGATIVAYFSVKRFRHGESNFAFRASNCLYGHSDKEDFVHGFIFLG